MDNAGAIVDVALERKQTDVATARDVVAYVQSIRDFRESTFMKKFWGDEAEEVAKLLGELESVWTESAYATQCRTLLGACMDEELKPFSKILDDTLWPLFPCDGFFEAQFVKDIIRGGNGVSNMLHFYPKDGGLGHCQLADAFTDAVPAALRAATDSSDHVLSSQFACISKTMTVWTIVFPMLLANEGVEPNETTIGEVTALKDSLRDLQLLGEFMMRTWEESSGMLFADKDPSSRQKKSRTFAAIRSGPELRRPLSLEASASVSG